MYILDLKNTDCTGWKGNKCHAFNSRGGRLKGPIYICIMGSKLDSFFFQKKVLLVLFWSRRTAYIVRDNTKTFTSIGLFYKDIILFSKKLRVRCSLRQIK